MPAPIVKPLIAPNILNLNDHPFPLIRRISIAYPADAAIPNHTQIWTHPFADNALCPLDVGLAYLGFDHNLNEAEPSSLTPSRLQDEAYMCETFYLLIIRECGYPPPTARFIIAVDIRDTREPIMGCWASLVLVFNPDNPVHRKYVDRVLEQFPRPDPNPDDSPDFEADIDISLREAPHLHDNDPMGDPNKYR